MIYIQTLGWPCYIDLCKCVFGACPSVNLSRFQREVLTRNVLCGYQAINIHQPCWFQSCKICLLQSRMKRSPVVVIHESSTGRHARAHHWALGATARHYWETLRKLNKSEEKDLSLVKIRILHYFINQKFNVVSTWFQQHELRLSPE